jgi:uncharacterized membrane protein
LTRSRENPSAGVTGASKPRAVPDPARQEEFEARFEAAPAVVVIMCLQLALALISRSQHWSLWIVPWWSWLVGLLPELALLAPLAFDGTRSRLEQIGQRRNVTVVLFSVVSLVNTFLLVAVIASLVSGQEKSGGQLLLKALTVWSTNTITFGLWFWAVDRGGPARRLEPDPPPVDFQFPQLADGSATDWHPRFFDYLYVSFTNAIAFSPTDTLPLTHTAKRLMLAESAVSALTLLLVAARAVNIFK